MAAVRPTGIGSDPGTADPLPGPTLGFLLPAGKVSSPCLGPKGTRVPPTMSSCAQSHRSLPSSTAARAGQAARRPRGCETRGSGAAASRTRPSPTRLPSTSRPHHSPVPSRSCCSRSVLRPCQLRRSPPSRSNTSALWPPSSRDRARANPRCRSVLVTAGGHREDPQKATLPRHRYLQLPTERKVHEGGICLSRREHTGLSQRLLGRRDDTVPHQDIPLRHKPSLALGQTAAGAPCPDHSKALSTACGTRERQPPCPAQTIPQPQVLSVPRLVPGHRASLTQGGWDYLYYIFIAIENIEIYKYIGFDL